MSHEIFLDFTRLTIDDIILKIADLQMSADRTYFPEGIFESFRENNILHYRRPDTNVFFTTITVFTLNSIKENLSQTSQTLIEKITEKAIGTYPLFQNKDGLNTYNFFQTKPSQHFPHGNILHKLNHFKIPDDIDDTSMVFLTKQFSKEEAIVLKDKLVKHSNGYTQTIENTFEEYKTLKAYSTWFGKKMYIEFDACALSNMIYCLLSYDVALDQHGEDAVKYLQQIILSNQYINQSFRVAHHYVRTPIIMYHIARLMAKFRIEALEVCRKKLVADMLNYLKRPNLALMDRILIETSLLRFNISFEKTELVDFSKEIFTGFYFFIAGLLTAYENPILYKIASSKIFHINWTCEAHCWALLAEWMTISSQKDSSHCLQS